MKKKNLIFLFGALLTMSLSVIPAFDWSKETKADEESEVTALKSYVSNLNLKGYVGTNLKNNIKFWQATAYDENPNIIQQIKDANSGDGSLSLGRVLGQDYFGVDGYFDIDIRKKDNKNTLSWKMNYVPGSFGDRDIRYSNDPAAITNWSGCKEWWIKVDASEISGNVGIRPCFEDDSSGRESFNLKPGSKVKLYCTSSVNEVTVEDLGYVSIPGGFVGYLSIPFDDDHYECYWCEGGNRSVDTLNVAQFQIAIRGDDSFVGKCLYLSEFGIVGVVNGSDMPFDNGNVNHTYKVIWDLGGVSEKKSTTNPSGLAWYGEFVGKLLTGIAFSYKAAPDQCLVDAADDIINDLEKAQGEDGYLGVFIGGARYAINADNWDLWNQYHAVVGLLEWYKISGNQKCLDISRKCLDCIMTTFANRSYIVRGGFETNRGIAHGFALMYQITRENKYLAEAQKIIEQDCKGDKNGWYNCINNGRSFYQSSSARWEVLHQIMTLGILYEETGDQEYYEVMEYLWYDILGTDIHNDGGFTTNEGAVGDPYREGVIETCCTIAWAALTNEFYKVSKLVEVADELERSYYNALLGSLLDDDRECTYNTPVNGIQGTCGTYDGRRVKSQQDISFQFNAGSPDMNCCQANFARGIGQISEWAIMTDANELYLNYYGNCEMETKVADKNVTIKQVTTYPNNGSNTITISGLEEPTNFVINFRCPTWAHGSKITYNGKTYTMTAGEYFPVSRNWKNGDTVQLEIAIGYSFWKGAKSQANYTSVYRGPILLTLDQYYLQQSGNTDRFGRSYDFDAESFAEATVSSGTAFGAWMFVDVPYGDTTIRLVDFASAGKYNGSSSPSSYFSWLVVEGAPETTDDEINIWKSKLYNKVSSNSHVVFEKGYYQSGETVKFTVTLPEGKVVDQITGMDNVSKDGDVYSFEMPERNVTLKVTFKDAGSNPGGDSTENPSGGKGCGGSIAGTAFILSSILLGSVLVLKHKKED